MVNPLVLRFCLWLLSTTYFDFREQIYDKLASYVARRVDCYTLNTKIVGDLFPAIGIGNRRPNNNSSDLKFCKDVFKKCVGISVLQVDDSDALIPYTPAAIDAILARLSPNILNKLTVLSINKNLTPDMNIDRSKFNILMMVNHNEESSQLLQILLMKYNLLKRNPHVYLTVGGFSMDLKDHQVLLMSKSIKQLHLDGNITGRRSILLASGELPYCPLFTCFIVEHLNIDDSVPKPFMKAVKDGNFPNLRRIELIDCKLNDCEWQEVPEFSLDKGTKSDPSEMQKIISQLSELTLDNCFDINHIVSKRLERLAVIKLTNATHCNLLQLNDILREGKLPNLSALVARSSVFQGHMEFVSFVDELDPDHVQKLQKLSLQRVITQPGELKMFSLKLLYLQLRELDMSDTWNMTGNLSALVSQSFPRLNTLKLGSCELNSDDVMYLCHANVQGKLPELKHLDVSGHQDFAISDLFADSVQWNQLKTLSTSDLSVLNIVTECLTSLEELTLLISEHLDIVEVTRNWPRLLVLQLAEFPWLSGSLDNIASEIIDGVERGLFPTLKILRHRHRIISPSELFKLYKTNISVEQI